MVEKSSKLVPDTTDEDVTLDQEVIFKPRTDYSNKVLKKVVPSLA
jgi:hypothetical protein